MTNSPDRPRALIEDWFPFEEVGIECERERGVVSALPALYYLHVWWARRPLAVARAAILGSILPASTDRETFKREFMRFAPSLREKFRAIQDAKNRGSGVRVGYDGDRVYKLHLDPVSRDQLQELLVDFWGKSNIQVMDPMAGGGSIPFEVTRLGLQSIASDLNPVAATVLRASLEYPSRFGSQLVEALTRIFAWLEASTNERLASCFPETCDPGDTIDGYLWARVVRCPNDQCQLAVPLAPNWKLSTKRRKIILDICIPPESRGGRCEFKILANPSPKAFQRAKRGTVYRGVGTCPRCQANIPRDYIHAEAKAGRLDHQLLVVIYLTPAKPGSRKKRRQYRLPGPVDVQAIQQIEDSFPDKLTAWEQAGLLPEAPTLAPVLHRKGVLKWYDLFNSRQLLANTTVLDQILTLKGHLRGDAGVEIPELIDLRRPEEEMWTNALVTYVQLAFNKLLNYNSILTVWMPLREVVVNSFNRHDFTVAWTYSEMAFLNKGLAWACRNVVKALRKILKLLGPVNVPPSVMRGPAQDLAHFADASVDVVIVDPPYFDNVQYALLSDFFYVWMRITMGDLYPTDFKAILTNKDAEAVADPSAFALDGEKSKTEQARDAYESRMIASFQEIWRVLSPKGVLTVMFTHKDDEAWEVIGSVLFTAGFEITAAWPVHAESTTSMHIAKKAALRSTVLLVCRKRRPDGSAPPCEWEAAFIPRVESLLKSKMEEFRRGRIPEVDLPIVLLAPVLQEYAKYSRVIPKDSPTPISVEQVIRLARAHINDLMSRGH